MSGTEHTPGPWRVDTEVRGLPNWVDVVGPRIRVGSPTFATNITYEESRRIFADARLIAAAPDMLKALEGAQQAVSSAYAEAHAEWQNADKRAERHGNKVRAWREQAIAAIAKATGGGQ